MNTQTAVAETTVQQIVQSQPEAEPAAAPKPQKPARGARSDAVVVTPDTYDTYVEKMLPAKKPAEAAPVPAEAKPAEKQAEPAKAEAQPAAEEEIDHPEPTKKDKLNARFSELTKARKEAEAKAEAQAKAAQEARREAEEARRQAEELKAKYEPPKSDEIGPEPLPAQFSDVGEYAKAIKDWTADKTRRDDAAKAAAEQAARQHQEAAKAFEKRMTEAKAELPDYDEKVGKSTVRVSDQARDAILRSDVGPKIVYHLAENPDFADKLAKMTVGEMHYELGKLAATLGGSVKKATPEKQDAAPQKGRVEISQAPAPIQPLGTGGAPVLRLTGHDPVPASMTYEDWKAARRAGKIK